MGDFDLYSILIGTLLKLLLGYILIGIIIVMLTETIISLSQLRGRLLKRGLKKVVDDSEVFNKIFNHPLIQPHGKFPAYINFSFFTDSLIECLKLEDVYKNLYTKKISLSVKNGNFSKFLIGLIQRNNNLKDFKKSLISWILDYMRNLSGIYNKYVKIIITSITLFIVFSYNLDSIEIFQTFYRDDVTKNLISAVNDNKIGVDKLEGLINKSFPIGWKSDSTTLINISSTKIIGLLITTVMISMASIMVFDIMGKYVNIRNAKSPYYK